jgi:hypothetical protein
MIGRDDINDLEAILSISNSDVDSVLHTVKSESDALFSWDYERSRPALVKLYEKAKTSQWNVTTDLDWSIEVDQAQSCSRTGPNIPNGFGENVDLTGTPFESWTEDQWIQMGIESQNWTLSQFLHGEQALHLHGADRGDRADRRQVLRGAQAWTGATSRCSRYLDEVGHYPINAHLKMLLDDIISDSRWDMTYLGMQIMVEGWPAALRFHQLTTQPLKKLLRYVMSDEAATLLSACSLQEFYTELNSKEIREVRSSPRGGRRMRDRFLQQEAFGAWVDSRTRHAVLEDDTRAMFQGMLFPRSRRTAQLGLLDAGDGWLRERFTELGVIQFEDWTDTTEEYSTLDEVAKDRDAA